MKEGPFKKGPRQKVKQILRSCKSVNKGMPLYIISTVRDDGVCKIMECWDRLYDLWLCYGYGGLALLRYRRKKKANIPSFANLASCLNG